MRVKLVAVARVHQGRRLDAADLRHGGVQSGHGSRPLRQAGMAIGAGAQPRQQGFGHQLGVRYLRDVPVAPNPTTVALGTSVAIRCTTSRNAGRLWSP